MAGQFYVYAIMDGPTCLYVGKGSGYRAAQSARRHGGKKEILERFECETEAFKAERRYIAELLPQNNVCPGGNGGRSRPRSRFELPTILDGVMSAGEWRRHVLATEREAKEIEKVGARRYVARFLCANWKALGLSKLDASRLSEVAYG